MFSFVSLKIRMNLPIMKLDGKKEKPNAGVASSLKILTELKYTYL